MAEGHYDSPSFIDENGNRFELTGWRAKDGDWHDVEKGDRMPHEGELTSIDLVTLNLDPDSDRGFYRSYNLKGGFDPDYEIEDLAVEAYASYE